MRFVICSAGEPVPFRDEALDRLLDDVHAILRCDAIESRADLRVYGFEGRKIEEDGIGRVALRDAHEAVAVDRRIVREPGPHSSDHLLVTGSRRAQSHQLSADAMSETIG